MIEPNRRQVLSAAAGALLLPVGKSRAQGQPLRIGVLNDPSGIYADNGGLGSVIAAHLAVDEMGGAVMGRNVEIIAGDHQNKADLAASISREWIDTRGVEMIVDGASSAAALAIQQICREKQKIFIATGAATSDLTGTACSPFGFQFAYDTYALARGTGTAVTAQGGDSWFFITADYSFGYALQRDTTRFIEEAGGKVIGSVVHPAGTTDFSSYLLQAQASGAKVIALANAGADTQNSLKQAGEFGITSSNQKLVALLIFITDVVAVGLPVAHGLLLTTSFYWDRTAETRAWSQRFMTKKDKPPSLIQAGTYSGVLHYLRAAQAAGSVDAKGVAAKMREMPVTDMNNDKVTVRKDGRVMCDMYLMQVKTEAESKYRFDAYKLLRTLSGEQAFRPISEGGCPLVGTL